MEPWGHGRAHRGPLALCWLLAFLVASPAGAQSSLKSRRDINVGNHPVAAIAADFDGDGNLDIVSVDQQSNSLGMIKGFGDGTFRRIAALPVGSLPTGVVFADATSDGIPDLITSNLISQEVSVNVGDGHGGYATRISTSIVPVTPLYAASFGVPLSAIGLTIALYGFARFLVAVPAGRLADRFGRRGTLALGGIVTLVGNVLYALAPSYPLFLGARFVAGAGAALIFIGL